MSRYTQALGLDAHNNINVTFSVQGAAEWGLSKLPAVLGGHVAEWAWKAVTERFPEQVSRRGAEVVGAVGVLITAYVLQIGLTKAQGGSSQFVDRVTDGMVGRISPELTGLFKRLFNSSSANGRANGRANGVTCDGDRDAVKEIGELLYASPETTQELGEQMVQVLEREGMQLGEGGRRTVVQSVREVAGMMAQGAL